jgi:hypothetical protein
MLDGDELLVPSNGLEDLKRVVWPRVIQVYVSEGPSANLARLRLPDARELLKGAPQIVLLVDGDPGANGFEIRTHNVDRVWQWPSSGFYPMFICIGLANNETEGGKWAICRKSYELPPVSPSASIVSFGNDGDLSIRVNRYDIQLNTWTLEATTTIGPDPISARFGGASWEEGFALLSTEYEGLAKYEFLTTSILSTAQVFEQYGTPMTRVSKISGDIVHFCFGSNFLAGSYGNIIQRYFYGTNTWTTVPTPGWIDWEGAEAASCTTRGPRGCLVLGHVHTPPPAYSAFTSFFFTLSETDTSYKIAEPTEGKPVQTSSIVQVAGVFHLMGGYSYDAGTMANKINDFHKSIDLSLGEVWLVRAALPVTLASHGAQGVNLQGGSPDTPTDVIFSMGRTGLTATNNDVTYRYNETTQTYTVLRTDDWSLQRNVTGLWTNLTN